MENINQDIDDIFKNGLEDFTPTPPASNWTKVAAGLEGEEIDSFVKTQLDNIESTPNPEIWTNIKKELPLSLLLRNKLNWLSRIAAVLIIFMVTVLVLDKKEIPTNSTVATIDNQETQDVAVTEESVDFVFDIDESEKTEELSASEELSMEDEKIVDDFWASVMDEDDDFAKVDEEVIEKSLEPLLELPIENLEAALPKNNLVSKKQLESIPKNEIILPNGIIISEDK